MRNIAKNKIKDVLVTRTAIKCLLPTEVVEKIVNFQGKDANAAVKIYKEVEFVGWGKFMIRDYKVRKRIASLQVGIEKVKEELGTELPDSRMDYLALKLAGMNKQLEFYKSKLNNE